MSDDLFAALADAKSRDRGPLADAKAAAGLFDNLTNSFEKVRELKRQKNLEDYFDTTQIPNETLQNVFPGMTAPMTFGQGAGLTKGNEPFATLFKPHATDDSSVAVWALAGAKDAADLQRRLELARTAGLMHQRLNKADVSLLDRTGAGGQPKPADPTAAARLQLDQAQRLYDNAQKQIIAEQKGELDLKPDELDALKSQAAFASQRIAQLSGMPPPKPQKPKVAPVAPPTVSTSTKKGGGMSDQNKSLLNDIKKSLGL